MDIRPETPRQYELPELSSPITGVIPGVSSFDTAVGEPPPPPPPPVEQKPVRPGAGIRPPTKVHDVAPVYPPAALAARIQGTVIVECVVLPDGSVGKVEIVKSLDSAFGLDQEAIKAAKQWKFIPGTRFGEPVAVLVTIELTFTLR